MGRWGAPWGAAMGDGHHDIEPAEPTQEAREAAVLDSVRTHLCLLEPKVVTWYLSVASALLALDNDVSPREAIEQLVAGGAFVGPGDEWSKEARNFDRFRRLTRARFAGAALQLLQRDPSRN